MEEFDKKKQRKKKKKNLYLLLKNAVTIGGSVAVGVGIANVVDVVDSNELDLL